MKIPHEFESGDLDSPYCSHWNTNTHEGTTGKLILSSQCGYPRVAHMTDAELVEHRGRAQ